MISLTENILPLCLAAFVMLFVFNFLYMRQAAALFTYVKEFHPKIWEELGHPTSFRNNPPSCQMKLLHYLKDKKFEEAGDPEMIRLCRGMLRMLTLGAAGVAVIIAGILAAVLGDATEHAG